ncbi:DUF1700 domain-containing protein [Dyella mobilis]|uniref:DUF1700 domain-containing protein n=1 Tax=Dyella mobilis TaxID=1849582 RepID=A0ABS2KCP1_9GAMM|nr:DUF1700 domain-containing protein [Dyella mobilis]MBM7128934.1 DUF1700 domain-containing protein [Dyella mobilis]GLQ99376.1 hypothetical protein GCM10007863_37960 [Dyella mobilis]
MIGTSLETAGSWLRRLDWSLHALPQNDRIEIIREMRSHIEDRISRGIAERDVLASLGSPEEYARDFHDEFELSKALGSRGLIGMLRVAVYWLPRSAAAFLALMAVGCLGLFGTGVAVTAMMRFVDPLHWGLWLSSHSLVFGYAANLADEHEVFGTWIYPFAVLCAVGCWMAGQATLLWALRTIARR